ncbi:MAG: preprotein translocase subunit SecY [Gammaproteobacteria bacterium]
MLKNAGFVELKNRLLFLLLAIVVYRIGAHIPVPGLDPAKLADLFRHHSNTIVGMFNMFSGGALRRLSIFALGVMPYISASIIIQLFTSVIPSLEQLKKEGEAGQRKINQYTRIGTMSLALFQGIGMAKFLVYKHIALSSGFGFYFTTTVTLATGTLFLMWLGEQITERGIGNGISMIIFSGIVSALPSALGRTFEMVREGQMQVISLLLLFAIAFGVVLFVVFVERGQRRITVNYAKRMQGRRMTQGQSTHLPFKLNMAGVIPPIFASSIIMLPAMLANSFGTGPHMQWLGDVGAALGYGQPLYLLLFAAAIVFFCYFYTALTYNPHETADNLKRSGAFIAGIRPGEQTARYIDTVMSRLTLFGAIYLVLVCLLPQLMIATWQVPFTFGGTSLLIIVVVLMDFMAQIQAHLMSSQYESLLKKAKRRGQQTPGSGLLG